MAKSISLGDNARTQDRIKLTFDPTKPENSRVTGKMLPADAVDIKLPQKLSGINKEIDFVNYCKLSYSRISNLNEAFIYQDKPEGSITPRSEGYTDIINSVPSIETFRLENLKPIESEYNQIKALGGKPSAFLEKYFENANKAIASLHNGIIFKKDYQLHIRGKDLSLDEAGIAGPLVSRFGMDPNTLISLTSTPLKKDELHFIERELFVLALTELEAKSSGEATINEHKNNYPNNVVLMDIFVREDGKIRKDTNSDNPETHTIALWKKRDKTIVLIDPSKVDYSKDLKKALELLAKGAEVQIHLPTKGILYGTSAKETGYSSIVANSIEKHKYRDCIDVAVKIGFELNELQIHKNPLTLEEIESALNLQISNQKDVATYLQNPSHGLPNRASLSSDPATRYSGRQSLEIKK